MIKEAKPKIEAIYPLSNMQTALLFHHLTEKDDQGFLNVQCSIEGDLNIEFLKEAWNQTINRHPVLRTSVHWKKIKNPIQAVVPNSKMDWNILDWSNTSITKQKNKLIELKNINKGVGIDFQKNPLSKINLIKTKLNSYYLIWCCHHLLLDGWSSSIILKDVLTFYDALVVNKKPQLDNIPSYKSYLNWLKKIDINDAETFWKKTFKDYKTPFLFNQNQHKVEKLVENNIKLSEETSFKVQELAKTYQTTLNTLFQVLWGLILSKYSNSYDIAFGNTVSGRSGDFPNIELIAGMFSNVIPVRTKLDNDLNIKDCIQNLQLQQLETRKYEHITINEITEWVDNTSNRLFDSLFIFENFPWNDIEAGNIKVHSSRSGITSTYPITLTIKPGKSINIHLLSDKSLFSDETNYWILNRFDEILSILDINHEISIESLLKRITTPIYSKVPNKLPEKLNQTKTTNIPKNETEYKLLEIWKSILKNQNINIEDNFFEIGGNSILSLQIISKARKEGIHLKANQLFENQTIIHLSNELLKTSNLEKKHNHVTTIRKEGNKTPLFCIHAGGGHVFFYGLLKDYIKKGRPIYALQPFGLNDENEEMHKNIEEMSKDYLNTIRKIQPHGPYNILVYCFSTSVGNEISHLLQGTGEKINIIVVDSMASAWTAIGNVTLITRIEFFLKRLFTAPFQTFKTFIQKRYDNIKPYTVNFFGKEHEKKLVIMKANLRKMSLEYEYKTHSGNVSLILTVNKSEKFEGYIIESWRKLAQGGVNVVYTKGYHATLFEKPDIEYVSEKIDLLIED